eukprot:scaffold74563_cov20-Cyclotella_meneghiniana.AAC.1
MAGVIGGGGGGDVVGMIVGGVFHTARNNNGRWIVYNGRRMLCRFGRDDAIDNGGLLVVHIVGREGGRYDITMLLMLILTKLMKGGGKEQWTLTTRRGSDAIFGVDFVG